jgi:hypothetical protein
MLKHHTKFLGADGGVYCKEVCEYLSVLGIAMKEN